MTFASDNFFSQISAKPSSRFLSHQYNSNLFHVGSFLLPSTPCPTSISQNSPNSSWQQEAHESLTWISAYDLQGKDIAYFLTQYWHWIHTQLCFLLKSQADIQCWLSLSNCQVSLVFLVSTGQISTFSSNPAGQLQTHTKLVSCKTITGWLQKINLVSDYQKKILMPSLYLILRRTIMILKRTTHIYCLVGFVSIMKSTHSSSSKRTLYSLL